VPVAADRYWQSAEQAVGSRKRSREARYTMARAISTTPWTSRHEVWLHLLMTSDVTVLLIGGRSGVGKTSVAAEASELLQAAGVAHCLIDGDNLAAAYPKASEDPHGSALAEANLRTLWAGYAAIGHARAIYVNTVSVLEAQMVLRAMEGGTAAAVLLTADDDTAAARLGRREIGSALDEHVHRSTTMAARLQSEAGVDVMRVSTDGRSVTEIAHEVLQTCGWMDTADLVTG